MSLSMLIFLVFLQAAWLQYIAPNSHSNCYYMCSSDGGCKVQYRGYTLGSCAARGGACVGTPAMCHHCNKMIQCTASNMLDHLPGWSQNLDQQTSVGLRNVNLDAGCSHPLLRQNAFSYKITNNFSSYNAALKSMKEDKTRIGFEKIGSYHGLPYRCNKDQSNIGNENGCCIDHWFQGSKRENFVTWHRLYMYNFEKSLSYHSQSKHMAVPYWDWTSPPNADVALPALAEQGEWTKGPILGTNTSTVRNFPSPDAPSKKTDFFRGLVKTSFRQTIYVQFNEQIVWPHNWIHNLVGGNMSGTSYASYDPIFYLHHSYVDLLFAYYQELQRIRFKHVSKKSFCKQADQALLQPFGNKHFNPYHASQKNSVGYQTLDYERNFCYKFDNLFFEGLTPEEFIKREEEELKNPQILAGIAIKTTGYPSTVTFELYRSSYESLATGAFHNLGNGQDPTFSKYTDYTLVLYDFTESIPNPAITCKDTRLKMKIVNVTNAPAYSVVYQPVVVFRPAGSYQYIYRVHTDQMAECGPIMHGLPGSKLQFLGGDGNSPKENDIQEYIIAPNGTEIKVSIDSSVPQEIKYNEHKYHHQETGINVTFGFHLHSYFKCDGKGDPACNPKYFTDGADAVTVVHWDAASDNEYVTAVQAKLNDKDELVIRQILLLAWCQGQYANVVPATQDQYENCSIHDLSHMRYGPASYTVNANTIGTYYFVHGDSDQCKNGWKIKIEVRTINGSLE